MRRKPRRPRTRKPGHFRFGCQPPWNRVEAQPRFRGIGRPASLAASLSCRYPLNATRGRARRARLSKPGPTASSAGVRRPLGAQAGFVLVGTTITAQGHPSSGRGLRLHAMEAGFAIAAPAGDVANSARQSIPGCLPAREGPAARLEYLVSGGLPEVAGQPVAQVAPGGVGLRDAAAKNSALA